MMVGCWRELRSNEYVALDLEAAQPTITWKPDQKWFLNEGQWLNYVQDGTEYTTPSFITVHLRFLTVDPRNGESVSDEVSFEILSSFEDYSDFCEADGFFNNLAVTDALSGARDYMIADKEMKEIQVWSKLTGMEDLAGTGCDILHQALEI